MKVIFLVVLLACSSVAAHSVSNPAVREGETCMELRRTETGRSYVRECEAARRADDLAQAKWCIERLKQSGTWNAVCDWRIVQLIEELLPIIKEEIRK